jgi:hypothetical protein
MLVVIVASAWAGSQDLSLSAMSDHGGEHVVIDLNPSYLGLCRQLGTMIANRPVAPAKTTGSNGFALTFGNTFAFPRRTEADGTPSPFTRADVNEDPGLFQVVPEITAQKGLPMSTEIGVTAKWIAGSDAGAIGVWGRAALVEGSKPWPDLSLHWGYSGLVGNDELEIGTADVGVTLGTTLPFGGAVVKNGTFSPWLDFTSMSVRAAPVLRADVAAEVGAAPVTGTKSSAAYHADMVIPQVAGGFQIANGTFLLRMSGSWAPRAVPTGAFALGFTW